ncbi:hypothetical protein C6501_10535 [Candidatus Poribacteria bacterium]|nr:MAG: hypothetical protein C6501_10535 [Candidatus Poribacteria bacterium]
MNRKFYVVCLLLFISLFALIVVFHGFSSSQMGSGSGSGPGVKKVAPSVKFKTWRIGRSPQFTDASTEAERFSFITSTQELCRFSASVGYGAIANKANTSPIDSKSVGWSVTGGSNKIKLDPKSVQTNWSGSNPAELDSSTRFNVVGSVTVEKVVGTRTTKSGKIVPDYKKGWTACTTDANRANRVPVHRDGTKMKFTLTFTARTKAGHTVTVSLPLEADDTDQLRQEYVDYGRPIPSRNDSKWTGENTYDFGHYKTMMDVGLATKKSNWVAEINKLRGTDEETGEKIPAFTVGDFVVTSGYRNPHHNFDHSGSTSLMSSHMYGYALDVRGKALAGGRLLDIDADNANTDADREDMTEAAKPNAGARYTYIYSSKHVHADWAPENWPNISSASVPTFSLPADGTTITATVACEKKRENSCSVQVSSSTEHYVTCPDSDCGESYWSCNSYDHNMHRLRSCTNTKLPNGNFCYETWRLCEYTPRRMRGAPQYSVASPLCVTDPKGVRRCSENGVVTTPSTPTPTITYACGIHSGDASQASSHTLQASCLVTDSYGQSCTVTSFYACQPHTHSYPALISGACGHTYTSANSYTHRLESCPRNSNGDSCTAGSSYACLSHTHVYPAPTANCARKACGQTVSNRLDHRIDCSYCGGHYWTCIAGAIHNHTTTFTCRRAGCGVTFTRCSNGTCTSNRGTHTYHWAQ